MHLKILVTRKELYNLVWTYPLKFFTENYMVSYSSFKKICLDNKIPIPLNGYWSKKKFGKEIEIPPLEKDKDEIKIVLYSRSEGDNRDFGNLTELDQKIIEIESHPKTNFSIPMQLSGNLDPILRETKRYLKKEVNTPDGLDYYARYSLGPIRCWVTKKEQQRALKIISVLLKNIKGRGHELTFGRYGSFVKLFGIEIQIQLSEKNKKVKFQGKYGEDYRYEATGDLIFQAGPNYRCKVWNDAKTIKLEEKLSSIIAWMEIEAKKERLWKIESDKREAERKEKERLERERQDLINQELKAFKKLYHKSELWHKAQNFRTYLRQFEGQLIDQNQLTKENIDILEFGYRKADWIDPLIQVDDDLLDGINPADYVNNFPNKFI